MGLSVIIPYHVMEDTTNLRDCLRTLEAQTWQPEQVLVVDDSSPVEQDAVATLCARTKTSPAVGRISLPYRELPRWAEKFNLARKEVRGDKILLLCANWLLARYALEVMERALDLVGSGAVVVSDSQRQQMNDAQGQPTDWFSYLEEPSVYTLPCLNAKVMLHQVNVCSLSDVGLIDVGFLTALHTDDWLPWDEDFDAVGGWHAVVEWGYRLLMQEHKRLYVARGLIAWHQPTGFTYNPGDWLEQTKASQRLLAQKVPGQAPE